METQQTRIHLTGNEGEEFDLELSKSWMKNHKDKHPGEPESHFFGKEILKKLLEQEDCIGLRFCYAHSKPLNSWQRSMVSIGNFFTKVVGNIEGEKHLIIIGAASDGRNLLPLNESEPWSKDGLRDVKPPKKYMVAQQGVPCPGSPGCPQS